MSEVVDMLSKNIEMEEFNVSRPGFVNDMRNAGTRRQINSSEESSAAASFADSSGWSTTNLAR